jgi:putative heme-binding domain-containing protein
VARVEKLVGTTGNPERGRAVYLDKRVQCANCHKLEGTGGQVGPDLSKIHETHSIAKLIESLVEPSKEIKEGFVTYTARTKDGLVHTGLKMEEAGGMVVLREASGKDVRIAKADLDVLQPAKASLMPDNVLAQLSYDEFLHLVAFLKSKEAQAKLREK